MIVDVIQVLLEPYWLTEHWLKLYRFLTLNKGYIKDQKQASGMNLSVLPN